MKMKINPIPHNDLNMHLKHESIYLKLTRNPFHLHNQTASYF